MEGNNKTFILYIHECNPLLKESGIYNLFSRPNIGEVLSLKKDKENKNVGHSWLVTYKTKQEICNAISTYHNKPPLYLNLEFYDQKVDRDKRKEKNKKNLQVDTKVLIRKYENSNADAKLSIFNKISDKIKQKIVKMHTPSDYFTNCKPDICHKFYPSSGFMSYFMNDNSLSVKIGSPCLFLYETKNCGFCNKIANLYCKRCGQLYCSQVCQMQHWSQHQTRCNLDKTNNLHSQNVSEAINNALQGMHNEKSQNEWDNSLCFYTCNIPIIIPTFDVFIKISLGDVISPDHLCLIIKQPVDFFLEDCNVSEILPAEAIQNDVILLAKNAVENHLWSRMIVQLVQTHYVKGFLIDWGKFVTVEKNQCYPISSELAQLPAQSFYCGLYGIKPTPGVIWNEESLNIFKILLGIPDENIQFYAKIIGQDETGTIRVCLSDTLDSMKTLDVSELMKKAGVACHSETRLLSSISYFHVVQLPFCCNEMKAFHQFFCKGMKCHAMTFQGSIGSVLQLLPSEDYPDLKLLLSLPFETLKLEFLKCNSSCLIAAYSKKLQVWGRAYVLSHKQYECNVYFVDFGFEDYVNEQYTLPIKFLHFPPLVWKIHSDEIYIGKWEGMITVQYISFKQIKIELSNENEIYCKAVIYPWFSNVPKKVNFQQQLKYLQNNNLDVDIIYEASLIYMPHQWLAVIQLDKDQEALCSLQERMQYVYEEFNHRKKFVPQLGEFVACKQFNSWLRSLVIHIEDTAVWVLHIDYGYVDSVDLKFLKPLLSEFLQNPVYGKEIILDGICKKNYNFNLSVNLSLYYGRKFTLKIKENSIPPIGTLTLIQNGMQLNTLIKNCTNKPITFFMEEFPREQFLIGCHYEMFITDVAEKHIAAFKIEMFEELKALSEDIERLSGIFGDEVTSFIPKQEEMCLARSYNNQAWGRACCLKAYSHSCLLYFVDYGTVEIVFPLQILPFDCKFIIFPLQAAQCKILNEDKSTDLKKLLHTSQQLRFVTRDKDGIIYTVLFV